MTVTVNREQNYHRAKCDDRQTCATRTVAGNVGAYWRGPHRSKLSDAHTDALAHLRERHGYADPRCTKLYCEQPAVGVVQRQGVMLLRCADHHVDLRNAL